MGTTLKVERKACPVRFMAAFLLLRGISCLLAYPWRTNLSFLFSFLPFALPPCSYVPPGAQNQRLGANDVASVNYFFLKDGLSVTVLLNSYFLPLK